MQIPDEPIDSLLRRNFIVMSAREEALFSSFTTGFMLRRIRPNHLPRRIENLDLHPRLAFLLQVFRLGILSRLAGLGRGVRRLRTSLILLVFFLFVLLSFRLLDLGLQVVINDRSRRRILPRTASAEERSQKCRVIRISRRKQMYIVRLNRIAPLP